MLDKEDKLRDQSTFQLSDSVQELNDYLLSVSWNDAVFGALDFNNSFLDNPSYSKLIELILNNIPEWERLINCRQHKTHDYCIATHTLLVIKKIQESEQFNELNYFYKLVLLYTALLHDIEKLAKEVDPTHPIKGAEKSGIILYRLGFGEDFIDDVYILIKHHQLFGLLAANRIEMEYSEIAGLLKKSILVGLMAILTIADIKSVKKDEAFFNKDLEENIHTITAKTKEYMAIIAN